MFMVQNVHHLSAINLLNQFQSAYPPEYSTETDHLKMVNDLLPSFLPSGIYLFIYLLCHIYPGVPHQRAALFSLGLLHYMHDKTNINQHTTFSYNTVTTVTTWYIHHYMHNVNYMFLITVVTCRCRFMFGQHYVQCI